MKTDSAEFFRDAQKSFQLAADSKTPKQSEYYAAIGRDYLRLAHESAEIVAKPSRFAAMWAWYWQ